MQTALRASVAMNEISIILIEDHDLTRMGLTSGITVSQCFESNW